MEKSIFYLLLQYFPINVAINAANDLKKTRTSLRRTMSYYFWRDISIREFFKRRTGHYLHYYKHLKPTNNRNIRTYIYDHKVLN